MIVRRSLFLMALALGPICWAGTALITPAARSFGAAILGMMEQTPEYGDLKALYDAQLATDAAAGRPSIRGKKLLARLQRLRGIAASASTVDPENPGGKAVVNIAYTKGRIDRFENIPPTWVTEPGERQDAAAAQISRIILQDALDDGLIPFDIAKETQDQVDSAMARGYEAARKKNFTGAIAEFEKARALAPKSPDIFYNLGLAESKVPGRELRAVCWLNAYIDFDPNSENAAAVRGLIDETKARGIQRFLKATQDVVMKIPDLSLKNICLQSIVELWANLGDYSAAYAANALSTDAYQIDLGIGAIANEQVRRGDMDGALKTAATIRDAGTRGGVLRSVSYLKYERGDLNGALQVVAGIDDPFCKATAYENLANARAEARDFSTAADLARKGIPVAEKMEANDVLRENAMEGLATSLAWAGDFDGAHATIAKVHGTFQIRLGKLYIAEYQAMHGDTAGSQEALREMRASLDAQPDSILEGAYHEIQGRIASGRAGVPDRDVPSKPFHSPAYWISLIETELSGREYTDLKAYFATLPTARPYNMIEAMEATAKTMLATYNGKIEELPK